MQSMESQISRNPGEDKSSKKTRSIVKKLTIRKVFLAMNKSNTINLDRPIPQKFAIWNVEKTMMLGSFFIITNQNSKDRRFLAIKLSIMIFMITFSIKQFYLSLIDTKLEENRHLIFILGDPTLIITGMREFFLITSGIICLMTAYFVYSFSFTKNIPLIQIFHFFEGKNGLTPRQMGITEAKLVKEMIARYKALVIGAIFELSSVLITFSIVVPSLGWAKCHELREFVFMILWVPYYVAIIYFTFSSIWASLIYSYISSYYVSLRAQLFNEKVDRILKGPFLVRKFTTKLEMKSMIKEHAKICMKIFDYDAFFRKFYFLSLIVSLPGTLIALNLVLFTEMDVFSILFYTFNMTFGWFAIFWASYVLAIVQHEVKKIYKKLCKLQWKFDNIPIELKIKIYDIVNHVGSSRNQIGFTVGGMFTMTFALAFKICLLYIRYFLLAHKIFVRIQ